MKIRKGLSTFERCFITFAICTALFLCVELYTYRTISNLWQDSYRSQIAESLERNANGFSDDLSSSYHFYQALQASDYFNDLSIKKSLKTPEDSYYIYRSSEYITFLKEQMPISENVFIHMKRSGAVLSSVALFESIEDCFQHYFTFDKISPADCVSDRYLLPYHLYLLPAQTVTTKSGSGSYVVCFMSGIADSCEYFFLIPVENIFDRFQLSMLPDETDFKLIMADGTVLLDNGADTTESRNCIEFTVPIYSISATAVLNVPTDFFKGLTQNALRNLLVAFLFSLVVGFALSFLFSHVNTKPIQELIHQQQIPQDVTNRNELVTIYNYISQAKENHVALQQQLLSGLLARAFSGLPIREDELSDLLANTELFAEPTQIAIVRYRAVTIDKELHQLMVFQFRDHLSKYFIVEPLNQHELGLIFPANSEKLAMLEDYLNSINSGLPKSQQIVCGVSSPFTGINNIPTAVQQSLFCVPEGDDCLLIFSRQQVQPSVPSPSQELRAFQRALFNWNYDEVTGILKSFSHSVQKESISNAQQIFYSILAEIKSAAAVIAISSEIFDECTFETSFSSATNILSLQNFIDLLFEQKASMRDEQRNQEENRILAFIEEHISDAAFSACSLSEEFGISERSLNSMLMNLVNMSFSSYLVSIRMQKAAVLLRERNMDVNSVIEQCGMSHSAFYRNFKNTYHITPSEYHEQYSGS